MESESKNIKMDILKSCWFMRGGLTYQEGLNLSQSEREIIAQLVKDNMETAKKT